MTNTTSHHLPPIAITLGDAAGIGPEILARLLGEPRLTERCIPVLIGDARVMARALELARVEAPLTVVQTLPEALEPGQRYLLDLANLDPAAIAYGQVSAAAGKAAGEYIETATRLALQGKVAAMVTNPIHKEAFTLGGYGQRFPGHTEMITHLTGAEHSCMMLASGPLRVSHVTTHVSLLDALTRYIRRDRILEVIRLTHAACVELGEKTPRIGVAGLNPHAGEHGLFGDDEAREIVPAVEAACAEGMVVEGPLPADTLFSLALGGRYAAVVALYHDQGHIPVKLAGFRYSEADGRWEMRGINITLGLPIIRTSVDHGTAFDKAGKGEADHHSLLDAVEAAVTMARGRAHKKR